MPILPFGEYRPDVSDYEGQTTADILNVFARGDGYGPVQDLAAYTGALPAPCRGYFFARTNSGSIAVFAGTSTKLYKLNNTTLAWADASKGSSTYSALAATAQWQFVQFNDFVIAVHVNVAPQVFDLTSSTLFDDLAGSPPQAAYISVVNRFIVLSGLASPNVYRIQWSGLNATTTWSSGVNSSDFQDLPDGGIVRGVAGGEFGVIFQDSSIRKMTFAPGAPYVFSIDRVSQDDGMMAPYSLVPAGDRVFWFSPQGFKVLVPGGYPTAIGKEKVDRTFLDDVDTSNLQLMIGAHDPRTTRVIFAYKSVNGLTGFFDKGLAYDWILDKWTPIEMAGEYIATLSKPGLTLEGVDAAYGTNLDTLTIPTLDDITISTLAQLSAVGMDSKLGFFTGDTLEAILESSEHGGDGKRIFVSGYRPVTDAKTVYGSVGQRETAQAPRVYTDEILMDPIGQCSFRADTRYARAKLRIPGAQAWTYAAGVEPEVEAVGKR